ncbi:hypothetical protein [Hymenobacter metallicola]|uniref:Peptidase C39-like domain-containing protein n=1 Tax=Hymenobacter metallicola TaxID=2563114 RepID=A0A4Z0QKP8_9BACT|nr:hypothetical protein [Hymenobacter metallicola]TGE29823.1 hypothetical protein E5K02_10290 [Hymenobacter metallicola]
MKPLTQLYTVAEHGIGDCLRTAFACVLDKEKPNDLPLFTYNEDLTEAGPGWFLDLIHWFREQGYELDTVNLKAIREGREMAPGTLELLDGYYVASGVSPRTYPDGTIMHHAVVAHGRNMEIVHDPHPSREGLKDLPEMAYTLTPCQ